MRLVHFFTSMFLFAFLATIFSYQASAENLKQAKFLYSNDFEKLAQSQPAVWDPTIEKKEHSNSAMAVDWMLFDSVANAYTYFIVMTNRPFSYLPESDTYLYITRGYWDPIRNPEMSNDLNSKNNLFLRTSTDNCDTWSDPILMLNAKEAAGEGRYPSVSGFMFENELTAIFCAPLVNESASTWPFMASGVYNASFNDAISLIYPKSFTYQPNGVQYEYSQDSRILGGVLENDPSSFYSLEVAELLPVVGGLTDNNNICIRTIVNVDNPQVIIPDQWKTDKWYVADQTDGRFNQVVDLKRDNSGNLYLGAYGGFENPNEGTERLNRPGVSKSIDNGLTWEDFNILPIATANGYAVTQGAVKLAFDWNAKDFEVLGTDRYSFIQKAILLDDANQSLGSQIVETYYENGNWNIRKVADISGYIMVYRDVTNTSNENINPMDIELQSSITKDGKNIIAKWVDLVDLDLETGAFRTSDIFIAGRNINAIGWSPKTNVTNDDILDRTTYIPDVVPNSLSQIPILRMSTKDAINRTDSLYASERYQHIWSGHVSYVVSVDEDNQQLFDFDIAEIYPNPAVSSSEVRFSLASSANIKLSVYDMTGRMILNLYNGYYNAGDNVLNFSTLGINSGAYYLSLEVNGMSKSKLFNIIK